MGGGDKARPALGAESARGVEWAESHGGGSGSVVGGVASGKADELAGVSPLSARGVRRRDACAGGTGRVDVEGGSGGKLHGERHLAG